MIDALIRAHSIDPTASASDSDGYTTATANDGYSTANTNTNDSYSGYDSSHSYGYRPPARNVVNPPKRKPVASREMFDSPKGNGESSNISFDTYLSNSSFSPAQIRRASLALQDAIQEYDEEEEDEKILAPRKGDTHQRDHDSVSKGYPLYTVSGTNRRSSSTRATVQSDMARQSRGQMTNPNTRLTIL